MADIETEPVESTGNGTAAPEPAAAVEGDSDGLQAALLAAQAEAADMKDRWLRAAAETQNVKRRAERERSDLIYAASERLIARILPVVDDFELAFAHVPAGLSKQDQTWVEGLALILRKLDAILAAEGVLRIDTAGVTFDPTVHEAVTHEVADGYGENQVIGEVRKGYRLGERVLRPALVRVAREADTNSQT